jgi:hypothetical protein
MSTYPLSREDLRQHLKEHLAFMDESARLYDEGKEHEAKRLATSIRVLVHDTPNSHSVLEQLGVKDQIAYWSVLLDPPDSSTRSYLGIGMSMGFGRPDRYVPILLPPRRQLSFAQWWNDEPLVIAGAERVTRKRAVLMLANRDGGAHVDPVLNDLDRQLARTDLFGWSAITITGGQRTVKTEETVNEDGLKMTVRVTSIHGCEEDLDTSAVTGMAGAAVRQVAHELRGTIREHLAETLG